MDFKHYYYKIFCVMQWNIGFARYDIKDIVNDRRKELKFKWLPLHKNVNSFADPFIFRSADQKLNLVYEEFSMIDPRRHGKILATVLDEDFTPQSNAEILVSNIHSSYPCVFIDNNITYIIPETSKKGKVSCYQYDEVNQSLINERVIINLPLLDSTIFKHNDKYWLFATLADHQFDHSKLYIYYANSLFGTYVPHVKNPVKVGLNGTRPAGNFFIIDGEIYRPAQNCKDYYGKSLTINKVKKLNEYEFSEEAGLELTAKKNCAFNKGLHTINVLEDVIVVDGIKMIFRPFKKWQLFFQKKFKRKDSSIINIKT